MNEILTHVIGVVLAALVVNLLRLNTKRVVVSHSRPVSWVWKAMALIGKYAFLYGLFVFIINMAFGDATGRNIAIGASILTFGLLFWVWGGLVIYFKKN